MKELKSGTVVFLLILAVGLVYAINLKRAHPGVPIYESMISEISSMLDGDAKYEKPYEELVITKQRSRTIHLRDKNSGAEQYRIVMSIVEDNVPLTCHYNGGEGNGGWDYPVPASRTWKDTSLWGGQEWKPQNFKNAYNVYFTIDEKSEVEVAHLHYTLTIVR
jgi:hypothetical protein